MEGKYFAYLETKKYQTKYRTEFITITGDIVSAIKRSGIKRGIVVIQTHHTTCSIWVNENEKNLIGPTETLGYESDLRKILDSFAHPSDEYGHNDIKHSKNTKGRRDTHLCEPDENGIINECINGHAHAQALLLQSSVSLIVEDGELLRGLWQEVMLVELDHDRERTVSFLISGVK
ncbi:MAG: YjbQ family protein [bacterium]|nr:YjbQ family protein [bacterium]